MGVFHIIVRVHIFITKHNPGRSQVAKVFIITCHLTRLARKHYIDERPPKRDQAISAGQ